MIQLQAEYHIAFSLDLSDIPVSPSKSHALLSFPTPELFEAFLVKNKLYYHKQYPNTVFRPAKGSKPAIELDILTGQEEMS